MRPVVKSRKVGTIIDINRPSLSLIVFNVDIDGKMYHCNFWGRYRAKNENITQDQYEDRLEKDDNYLRNKFWQKFNIDYENRDLLIGHRCRCVQTNRNKHNSYTLEMIY